VPFPGNRMTHSFPKEKNGLVSAGYLRGAWSVLVTYGVVWHPVPSPFCPTRCSVPSWNACIGLSWPDSMELY
jgi:hypothetical protein